MALYVAPGKGTQIEGVPGAAPLRSLGIKYVSQRPQANWCWAACTVMVASHLRVSDADLGGAPTMCHLAGLVHKEPSCCDDPSLCDIGAWPEPAYSHLRIAHSTDVPSPPINSETVLTVEEIYREIVVNRRPVEVLYKWNTRGAHVALITGIYEDGQIEIFDPWFGVESPVSYDYIKNGRGMGRWAGTYREFRVMQGRPAPSLEPASSDFVARTKVRTTPKKKGD